MIFKTLGYILVTKGYKSTPNYTKVTFTFYYFYVLGVTIKIAESLLFTRLSAYSLKVCVTGFEPTTFWSVAKSSFAQPCVLSNLKVTNWLHYV